jgi:ABC-type uncharacterized transport system substrate-binding protein
MKRREFILALGGAAAWPLAARAQQARRVYRIGILETISAASNEANYNALRKGLRELGYVEGENLHLEYRSADGRNERFPELATELVLLKVELIVARSTPAVLSVKAATASIPVVMTAAANPVGDSLVATLARPGGNITGLSSFHTELSTKRLGLLRTHCATGNPLGSQQSSNLGPGGRCRESSTITRYRGDVPGSASAG